MKHTLLIIAAGLIALVSGIAVRNFERTPSAPIQVSGDLFATELPDLSGQLHRLNAWQGKILILNFWATWCPPCLKEIPVFIQLQRDYAQKNVQFVGIALDEKTAVANYAAQVNINYPLLLAPDNGIDIARQWGNVIESVPFTVVVNTHGQIIHRQLGEISAAELRKIIEIAK